MVQATKDQTSAQESIALRQHEQAETFKVYRAILSAVGKTIEYDNVYPLLVASNSMSKTIIETAIKDLARTLL